MNSKLANLPGGQPILSSWVATSLSLAAKLNTKIWLVVATYNHEVRLDVLKETPLIDDVLLSDVLGSVWVRLLGGELEGLSSSRCLVPLSLVISPLRRIKQWFEKPTAARFRFSCTAKQVEIVLLEGGTSNLVDLTQVPGSPFFPGLSRSTTLIKQCPIPSKEMLSLPVQTNKLVWRIYNQKWFL